MNKIAILVTTFNRDALLRQTIDNILLYKPKDSIILIGDQNPTEEKLHEYEQEDVFYYKLPYDCGLSYSRNYLVNETFEFSCPYVLLMADSIQFIEPSDFRPLMTILEQNRKLGIIGFELSGSKCPWEFIMSLTKEGFYLDSTKIYSEINNIKFKHVDICRNIFLAKTETLLNLWDNDLKLAEHELALWNYKQRGYFVYWTDYLKFRKIIDKTSSEYTQARNRFNDYRTLLQNKLNISGWVTYSNSAMREIKEYKKAHEKTN